MKTASQAYIQETFKACLKLDQYANDTIYSKQIYEIRGERIMLDFDLADFYEIETKPLNKAVKRNIKRFPKDFMFRLTLADMAGYPVTIYYRIGKPYFFAFTKCYRISKQKEYERNTLCLYRTGRGYAKRHIE